MNSHDSRKDTEGLHADRPGAISTWSGGYIDPLDPNPLDINLADVAHALARLCRYNGHVEGFLSVARHSIWVSERVWSETGDTTLALSGLLHDGAEAYLSDVPRPVKRQLAEFQAYDAAMDEAVMRAFGLPFPIPAEVMDADRHVLLNVELPSPAGARHTWNSHPAEDERDFLKRYSDLRQRAGVLR